MYVNPNKLSNTVSAAAGTSVSKMAGQQQNDYVEEADLDLGTWRPVKRVARPQKAIRRQVLPKVAQSESSTNWKRDFLPFLHYLENVAVAGQTARNVPAAVQAQNEDQRSQDHDENTQEPDHIEELNKEEPERAEEYIEKERDTSTGEQGTVEVAGAPEEAEEENAAGAEEEEIVEAMDMQLHPCDHVEDDAAAPSTPSSSPAKTDEEKVPLLPASSGPADPANARKVVARSAKRKLCTKRGANKKRKLWNSDMTNDDFINTYKFITKEQKYEALHMQCEYFFKDTMPTKGSKADFDKTMAFTTPVGPKEYRKVESDVFRVNGVDELEVFDGTWSDAKVADGSFVYTKKNEHNMSEPWDDQFKFCCKCQGECKLESCECMQMSMKHGRALISGNMICTEQNRDMWNLEIFACGPGCHCNGQCENAVPKDATHPDLELVRHSDTIGYGIRTRKNLLPGRLVFEFVGQVTDADPSTIRRDYAWQIFDAKKNKNPKKDDYLKKALRRVLKKKKINFPERNIYIDPFLKGNIGRYASTSHLPNCQPIRVFEGDLRAEKARLFFYVTLPIQAGQEVVADYGDGYELGGDCLCGKPLCGKAGAFFLKQCKQKNKNGNILTLRKIAADELDVVVTEHLEKIWENSDALEESGLTMEELKAFVTKYVAVNRPQKTVNPRIINWLIKKNFQL